MLAPLALLAVAQKVSPRSVSRLRGVLRVATYATVVGAVASGLVVHSAKADVAAEQLTLGRDLAPLADLLANAETVEVNGERAHVATVTTNDSLEKVLERFSTSCNDNASPLADGWKVVPAASQADARDAIAAVTVNREITNDEGTVTCIVRGEKSQASFMTAARAFVKTGELGEIGQMRYAYAKRGADGKTFVITAWTDSSFNVRALTPPAGQDAPGSDAEDVPRPVSSQRVLTTGVANMPFIARAYTTSESPSSVLAAYDRDMPARGWSCGALQDSESFERSCKKDGRRVAIVAMPKNGSTLVSISEQR